MLNDPKETPSPFIRDEESEREASRQVLYKGRWRHKGIYLLPNLFTTAALFCGFFAIVQAMNGDFTMAAAAISAAMVLDSLDGRVARMTSTQSAFGAEYDSLSDMVSFGVAPGLVIYEWSLKDFGKFGWIATFVYVAGAALRLARFNTQLDNPDKRFFQGLPSPAAAALVAGFVWIMNDRLKINLSRHHLALLSSGLAILVGLTMVSNIPYYSFKKINMKRSVPFITIVLLVLAFALATYDMAAVLFAVFVLYWLFGYGYALWRWIMQRKTKAPVLK
jgi:CDP-diacylglycerol---serine O-phosphatidyltransferase